MPGYKKEAFTGPQEFPSHLLCVICNLILRSPVQTTCGHRSCEACVKKRLETRDGDGEPKCPVCPDSEPDAILDKDKVYPDFRARKELKTLPMQCVNEGCNWKGTFEKYMVHETECEFELIKCLKSGCGKSLRRADLAYHLEKDCPMRIVRCRNCGEEQEYKNMKKHNSECTKMPITCEDCGKKLTRDAITSHRDPDTGDCPNKTHHCPYSILGCSFTEPGSDGLTKHLQDEIVYHTLLQKGKTEELLEELQSQLDILKSYRALSNSDEGGGAAKASASVIEKQAEALVPIMKQWFITQTERNETEPNNFKTSGNHKSSSEKSSEKHRGTAALDRKIRNLEGNIKKLEQDTSNIATLYAVLDKRHETFQEVVAVLNNQLEAVEEKSSGLERENTHLKDTIERQGRQLHAHDQVLTVKNVTLAEQELRIQSLESSSYNGLLVWKITEFARRRKEAVSGKITSFYSNPFYTSYHGYKMRARIYLNGDGMGKGTHLSLFFLIMKGQYDNILHWPFRQKVTFMLVDQGHREHVVDAFRPDPTSSSFKKPTSEMNIASGCPLFVNLNQLQSNQYTYIKDDCLFVKVIVDVSDLERV